MNETEANLRARIAPVIEAMGYEFLGFELRRSSGNGLLRIYIDSESGILVDDCAKVSRQVSAMLDVEDPISGEYILEVSSPGIDRPLFEIAHYQKFLGSRIKLRTRLPHEGRRNFIGVLLRVEEPNIILEVDDKEFVLAFSNIEKAKLIADVVG
jgi:ribosome maturation factor RimP